MSYVIKVMGEDKFLAGVGRGHPRSISISCGKPGTGYPYFPPAVFSTAAEAKQTLYIVKLPGIRWEIVAVGDSRVLTPPYPEIH
jgi:hypothetical protein